MIADCGLGASSNPQSAIRNQEAREAQRAEHSIGNREVASSIPAAGSGGESYGEDSADHHRDEARALRGLAQESTRAQAHNDRAEFSTRLDSSDGRAPIS